MDEDLDENFTDLIKAWWRNFRTVPSGAQIRVLVNLIAHYHQLSNFDFFIATKILIRNGMKLNYRFKGLNYNTLLHLAVIRNNIPTVWLLLEYGADTFEINGLDEIPYTSAVKKRINIIEQILLDFTFDNLPTIGWANAITWSAIQSSPNLEEIFARTPTLVFDFYDLVFLQLKIRFIHPDQAKKILREYPDFFCCALNKQHCSNNAVTWKTLFLSRGQFLEYLDILMENFDKVTIYNNATRLVRAMCHQRYRISYDTILKTICFFLSKNCEVKITIKLINLCDRENRNFWVIDELFWILYHLDFEFQCLMKYTELSGNHNLRLYLRCYPFLSIPEIITSFENLVHYELSVYPFMLGFEESIKTDCHILNFSVLPEVKSFYRNHNMQLEFLNQLPEVPSLLELARNAYRVFLVNKYSIQECVTYYDVVIDLKVPKKIKYIMSYVQRLY